jgi:hypothetical protein
MRTQLGGLRKAASWAAALALAGCVTVEGLAPFPCADGACPATLECVAGQCVTPGGGSGGGGSGGSGPKCMLPSDCPGPTNECKEAECTSGICTSKTKAEGSACGGEGECSAGACSVCKASVSLSEDSVTGGKEAIFSYIYDLDGDGFPEPIWINQLDETAKVFWGSGVAEISTGVQTISVGRSGAGAAFGDVNGDGLVDVVTSSQDFGQLRVALQTDTRVFATPNWISQLGFPQWVTLLDVNGDQILDLLVRTPDLGCWTLRLGNGVGGFLPGACAPGLESSIGLMRAGDLDGDGQAEIVWFDPVSLLYVVGTLSTEGALQGTATIPVVGFDERYFHDLVDLDNDGRLDLIHSARAEANGPVSVVVHYNQGGLSFAQCTFYDEVPEVGTSFGDLDGDGKPEYTRATKCEGCPSPSSSTYYLGIGE